MSITQSNPLKKSGDVDAKTCYCHPETQEKEFGAYTISVGRDHYAVCVQHNAFRWVGSNLFSAWRYMTEEDFEQNVRELVAMNPIGKLEAEWQERARERIALVDAGGDCVLCPRGDIHDGGGIFWTDDKWICGACWLELHDSFAGKGRKRQTRIEIAEAEEIPF